MRARGRKSRGLVVEEALQLGEARGRRLDLARLCGNGLVEVRRVGGVCAVRVRSSA